MLLDELYVFVDDVVRELGVTLELEHITQILLFALCDTLEIPGEDSRTLLEEYLQVERITLDCGTHLDIREVAWCPETLHSVRDEVAGQIYRVTLDESC